MVANGYLLMFGSEHAEEQYEALKNHEACDAGTKNIKGSELSKIFPYINGEGIETATYTDNQSEGCGTILLGSPDPRKYRLNGVG